MSRALRIQISLFLLVLAGIVISYNMSKPRLLILHSYDTGYAWTRDVDAGISRVLRGKRGYSVRHHYMDTKRRPGKAFKEKAATAARRVVDEWRPDVLIAVDDDAQQYVARRYVGDPRMSIVFAGVNAEPERYGFEHAPNVTGMLERKPLEAVKRALQDMAPGVRRVRVVHIGDTSDSVREDDACIRCFDWSPSVLVRSILVSDLDGWKKAVRAAQQDADFIVTTNYRGLTETPGGKTLVKPAEVVQWTEENSSLPVVGTNGFYVEDGGGMAIATSAYEQGIVSAGMAVEIVEKGKRPNEIPVRATKQFVVYLRESRLKARGVTLPPVYEAFARNTDNYYP